MPSRLALFLGMIIIAFGLAQCDHQLRYRQIPFPVQQYFQQLPNWQYPEKIEVDYTHRRVYWLNKQGEIRAIGANGKNEVLINRGIGAKLGVTHISDFTIDDQRNTLYFTDLIDTSTGQAALKKSNLAGNSIETVTTFSTEIPYAIHWNKDSEQLYYTTREKGGQRHYLRQLGKNLALETTIQQVNNIQARVEASLHQVGQAQLVADHVSESTKMFSVNILE